MTCLSVIDFFVTKGLKTLKDDEFNDWTLLMNGQLNSEIVILGNSRALYHINPKIITDSTGLSCYNLGIDGGKTAMMETRLLSLFKHNLPPKMIVHTFDHTHLGIAETIFQKHQFLPYLDEKQIYEPLSRIDNRLIFDKLIPLWRYHGYGYLYSNSIKALIKPSGREKSTSIAGFLPQDKTWNSDFENFRNSLKGEKIKYEEYDVTLGLEYLTKLISLCKKYKVKLVIIYPPQFYELTKLLVDDDSFINEVDSICNANQVTYINYRDVIHRSDTVSFYNASHLNRAGANKFSSILAQDLINIFLVDKD